jgi:predicted phosphohydrolase
MRREIMRLEASLKAAGDRKKLVFLHYPPIYGNYRCEEILQLLKDHRVPLCCYGHIHGKGCAGAFNGWHEGTQFKLVSADFVNFSPVPVPIPELF